MERIRIMIPFKDIVGKPEKCSISGRTIEYVAWRGIEYCDRPKDPVQKLNVFMPAAYENGGKIGPYTKENAPVFMPNTVGGYMPGPANEPGEDRFGQPNSIFAALEHGYVAASGGVRGRTSGRKSDEFFEGGKRGFSEDKNNEPHELEKKECHKDGRKEACAEEVKKGAYGGDLGSTERDHTKSHMVGRAPAFIVDLKAIIRYIKANRESFPGDTDRIVTNGTSAGGALSALAGASGNSPDYEPYLKEIGAAEGTDDIFSASCYCPICNLENADAAYEWLYHSQSVYHQMKFMMTAEGIRPTIEDGELTKEQLELSRQLKDAFPEYVNSLKLTGAAGSAFEGQLLSLDENGEGSFRDHLCGLLASSLLKEKETGFFRRHAEALQVKGCMDDQEKYLTQKPDGQFGLDLEAFAAKITRMKPVPAFDAADLSGPENEEFGTEETDGMHFTASSEICSYDREEMADPKIIRMMNPMSYIRPAETGMTAGNAKTIKTAKHWRIRHGTFDRDTSFAVPLILALTLENAGYDVDFAFPWGLPHSGDYDLEELFAWIDRTAASDDSSNRTGETD